ncbi:CheR family methyltransferase [Serpentinicella alkaliphila]|uniref:protein-glutamate O-methyltransferase n=1 Tax=Serpentinicella alkaliphila TaxID=1734049 RepID=A0A4R2TH27_9FIRM|nr:protein-glutamate O-methyltransferase CheR [Serpentinicella alkaliphila]QUH26997.1 protein-glutamate O-methyltransferase CheR [Serpentinicella alkaliphila]TCQ01492.1 CheR-type MCP methyltransferase [Serpentinicella alkaliphila]
MDGYEIFKQKVYKKTGIDLSSYKERQMKRRIESLMQRNGFNDFDNYFNAFTNSKIFDEFINYLTINVSEFYRNPQQWDVLEAEVFPILLKNKSNIKIWSAACSTGEEPYSLVMLLTKFLPLNQINIIATDIDLGAINKAKVGLYTAKSVANLPKVHIDKYFTQVSDSYKISESIKSRVTFEQHNLLKDTYPKNCDLIICRNVMIYFTEEAKHEIYHKFHDSLVKDGILFVGSTEQIILPNRYNLAPIKTFFYKKM